MLYVCVCMYTHIHIEWNRNSHVDMLHVGIHAYVCMYDFVVHTLYPINLLGHLSSFMDLLKMAKSYCMHFEMHKYAHLI